MRANCLTCNNSSLNTGANRVARQTRQPESITREPSGSVMGKSERKKTVKKTATKANGKSAVNGRANGHGHGHSRAAPRVKLAAATVKAKPRRAVVVLPDGYLPTEKEPFMNEFQRIYFRNKLVAWKEEIVRQNRETLHVLHEDSAQHADLADRATSETDRALELRARDRQRKLISKIDAALMRIEEGTYGYCEETGEPIGLKRLDARPIATLSLEAQERHERREKVFRAD